MPESNSGSASDTTRLRIVGETWTHSAKLEVMEDDDMADLYMDKHLSTPSYPTNSVYSYPAPYPTPTEPSAPRRTEKSNFPANLLNSNSYETSLAGPAPRNAPPPVAPARVPSQHSIYNVSTSRGQHKQHGYMQHAKEIRTGGFVPAQASQVFFGANVQHGNSGTNGAHPRLHEDVRIEQRPPTQLTSDDTMHSTSSTIRLPSLAETQPPSDSEAEEVCLPPPKRHSTAVAKNGPDPTTLTPPAKKLKQLKGAAKTSVSDSVKSAGVKGKGKGKIGTQVGGRPRGSTNFCASEDRRVVEIWWDKLPAGRDEIKDCADMYNVWAEKNGYKHREGESLKKRVKKIADLAKPTGNPEMADYIEKAKALEANIRKRTKTKDVDDDDGFGSETATSSDEDDEIGEDFDKEMGNSKVKDESPIAVVKYKRGKDKSSSGTPSDWSRVSQPRRGGQAAETKAALSAFLDPAARMERATAIHEQRATSALFMAQIQDLQLTLRAKDAKIDELERLIRSEKDATHAAQRELDRTKNELTTMQMFARLAPSGTELYGQPPFEFSGPTPFRQRFHNYDTPPRHIISTPRRPRSPITPYPHQEHSDTFFDHETSGAGPSHVSSSHHSPSLGPSQPQKSFELKVTVSPSKVRDTGSSA